MNIYMVEVNRGTYSLDALCNRIKSRTHLFKLEVEHHRRITISIELPLDDIVLCVYESLDYPIDQHMVIYVRDINFNGHLTEHPLNYIKKMKR